MSVQVFTADINRVVQSLYEKATSAVLINGTLGDWFRTTIGIRQGCILSHTLFNIFLEKIVTEALEKHHATVSIGGRTITNLRFADDIDGLSGREEELEALAECLDTTSRKYGLKINTDKTKVTTSNPNGIQNYININDHTLDTVSTFKYLGSIISEEGSKPEILARTAQGTAAMTKLKIIWKDNNIQLSSKVRLMRALVISIFLYACEYWTLTAELERRIGAMEMRCYRKLLGITYLDRVTNDNVRRMIKEAIGPYDELLSINCQVTQTEMVWPHDEVNRTVENHTAGDSRRNQKARRTEKKMGRRHRQMDRVGPRRNHETDQGPTSMDPAVRDVYCGAPTIV